MCFSFGHLFFCWFFPIQFCLLYFLDDHLLSNEREEERTWIWVEAELGSLWRIWMWHHHNEEILYEKSLFSKENAYFPYLNPLMKKVMLIKFLQVNTSIFLYTSVSIYVFVCLLWLILFWSFLSKKTESELILYTFPYKYKIIMYIF